MQRSRFESRKRQPTRQQMRGRTWCRTTYLAVVDPESSYDEAAEKGVTAESPATFQAGRLGWECRGLGYESVV